jgi:hypothetical protein
MKRLFSIGMLALAGAALSQELWHIGTPANAYGIFFMVPVNLQSTGGRGVEQIENGRRVVYNAPNMNVNSKQETMVGSIVAKVSDTVLGEYACKKYDSTYTVQGRRGTVLRNVTRRIETWVDFKGITRRVRTFYRDDLKQVEIDATFEKDTIEMDIRENGKARHMSLNPVQGIEAFSNPTAELIKNADKDRYEKLYCTIDPTNGGILQYKMRVHSRFVPPTASSSKVKGFTIEVKAPSGIHMVHVSDDGQLRQIDFADTSVVRAANSSTLGGG